jgi:ORF6C domain
MEVIATALAIALATKAFEKIGEKTGENIQEKATSLIKGLFQPNELIALNLSAEHLSQPIEQGKLIGKLEDRLAKNPDIAQQLQTLLDSLKEKNIRKRKTNIRKIGGNYAEENSNNIVQNAKGKNIQQIGQVNGNVIYPKRFQNVTQVQYESDLHITDQQAKQIQDKIAEIVDIHDKAGKFETKESKSEFFGKTWNRLKKRFNVTSYKLLPKHKFDECMNWLQSEIGKNTKKLRRTNNSEWRNRRYTAINTRAKNQLRMDKEEIYEFAFQRLKLKQSISSLTELNDTNLDKLYKIIIAK